GDGQAVPAAEDSAEVVALHGLQLVERRPELGAAIGVVRGHDHVAHDRDAIGREEHVLRAHEPDALGAERAGAHRVLRRVGIGAHAELAVPIGPAEELLGEPADLGRGALDRVEDHLAGLTVDGDHVALAHHAPARLEHAPLLVDDDVARAHDARPALAVGNHRRVRGTPGPPGPDARTLLHSGPAP